MKKGKKKKTERERWREGGIVAIGGMVAIVGIVGGEKKEMKQSTMPESSSTIAETTAMSSLSISGDLLIC